MYKILIIFKLLQNVLRSDFFLTDVNLVDLNFNLLSLMIYQFYNYKITDFSTANINLKC